MKRNNENALMYEARSEETITPEANAEYDPNSAASTYERGPSIAEKEETLERDASEIESTRLELDELLKTRGAEEVHTLENARANGLVTKEAFDLAFAQTHTFDFHGDTLEYAKIEPQAEALKDDNWVVFVGGFNTAKASYYNELLNLARSGRKVLFINPETNAELSEIPNDDVTAEIPNVIRTQALALGAVLAHEGISNADFVAHSRGGAVATTLVAANPSIAKRMLLDSPAGLTGKEPAAKLLGRSLLEFGSEIFAKFANSEKRETRENTDYDESLADNFEKRLMHRFGWKIGKEMPAIAKTDIRPLLEHIKNANIGSEEHRTAVEIILLNANSDHIFTPEKIASALSGDPFRYLDRWVNYAEKDAAHGKISRPRPGVIPEILTTEEGGGGLRPSMIAHILSERNEKEAMVA